MIFIPVGISCVGIVLTLLCRARITVHLAIFTVLALAVMVPSHAPPREVLVMSASGAAITLLIAIVRSFDVFVRAVPNLWLLAFLLLSATVTAFESDGSYALFVILSSVVYVLLSLIVSSSSLGTRVLIVAVPAFVVVQFLLTFSEEFLGLKALWPQTNGHDNITSRINPIAPWLAGRAMGSTSQPIPLGILAGLLCLLCIWMALNHSKSYWVFAGIASVVLLFSGTRSSFLALFVCIAFWLVVRAGLKRIPVYLAVGALVVVSVIGSDALSLLGFSNFSSTTSYVHRADVLTFIPELANRTLGDLFFGSGYSSIGALLQSATFGGGSGILVFDQEFIRTLTATGVLGLGLLFMAFVEGFRRGNLLSRLILIFLGVSFLSFDALSWNMSTIWFVFAASGPVLPALLDGGREPGIEDSVVIRGTRAPSLR